jgi:hypothetical protein
MLQHWAGEVRRSTVGILEPIASYLWPCKLGRVEGDATSCYGGDDIIYLFVSDVLTARENASQFGNLETSIAGQADSRRRGSPSAEMAAYSLPTHTLQQAEV